jgi:hypothetical protein
MVEGDMSYSVTQVLAAILFLTVSGISRCEDLPLNVEIKPASAIVKSGQEFSVTTKVKNVGKGDQRLEIWSCSYPEHWTADSPSVLVEGVECEKNALVSVRLKPGEAYEKALSLRVWVAAALSEESVTFRLGFAPWIRGAKRADRTNIWSNDVTVNVRE